MPDQPRMLAWAVSLQFEGGPMIVNAVVAPSSEAAVAIVAVQAVQQLHIEQKLTDISFVPITTEWLEFAVKATKGQPPEGGAQVLSLVPKPEEPEPEKPQSVVEKYLGLWNPNFPPAS